LGRTPQATGLAYVSKVRLAVALGLIPEKLARILELVGHLRNHFAHRPSPAFNDPEIKKLMGKLTEHSIWQSGFFFVVNDARFKAALDKLKGDDRKCGKRGKARVVNLFFSILRVMSTAEFLTATRRITPILSSAKT
jgi:hypothetical protein